MVRGLIPLIRSRCMAGSGSPGVTASRRRSDSESIIASKFNSERQVKIVMASGKSKSIPPSRIRYEKANPAVTVRIPLEFREELAEAKEKHNLSLGDVLRIGLDKAKPDLDAAYQQGLLDGYDIGERDFEVTYYCSRCRCRHLSITSSEAKEAAAKLMYEAGWHSPTCR